MTEIFINYNSKINNTRKNMSKLEENMIYNQFWLILMLKIEDKK